MYFTHSKEIWSEFPSLSAGALVVDGVHSSADFSKQIEKWYLIADKRLSNADEGDMPEIQAWRKVFTQMGLKPTKYRCAAESLLRRFKKDKSVPKFHPIVDICNAFSLAYAIPIAVIDLEKVTGGITVQHSDREHNHLEFSDEVSHPEENEVVFGDEAQHAHSRRWCFRQSKYSVVTKETTSVLIIVEAHHTSAKEDIVTLLQELQSVLTTQYTVQKSAKLSAEDSQIEFTVHRKSVVARSFENSKNTMISDDDSQTHKRVLSGMQPSGKLHLGNYFGSMLPNLEMSKEAEESIFFIVDLHALTTIHDADVLRKLKKDAIADYLAVGFDPEKTIIFHQSDVSAHAELSWILSCITPMGLLERAVSYKDKVERGISASAGLFTYPILMTADIILYDIHTVPVGKDQKQHVEMARDIAIKFNSTFGETFIVPEPKIREDVAVVPGIDGQKMSKSYGNTIPLFGDEKETKKVIMSIVTDSREKDDPKDPDTCVVFQIHKLFLSDSEQQALAAEYKNGLPYGDAKKKLLETYMDYFAPMRAKRESLTDDYIQEVLQSGAARASAIADKTMEKVKRAVGLL